MLLGLILFAVLIAGALYLRTRAGRRRKEVWLYRSAFYRRLLLIRFTLSLSSFLESGKPLSEALAASMKVLGNHVAEDKVRGMERKLMQGRILRAYGRKAGSASRSSLSFVRWDFRAGSCRDFWIRQQGS